MLSLDDYIQTIVAVFMITDPPGNSGIKSFFGIGGG